jgi:flavin-dependent dehydrogenase
VVLAFLPDLTGYGWCYRKGDYVNVGFGRYGSQGVRTGVSDFVAHLIAIGVLAVPPRTAWHGHAYRVSPDRRADVGADGVLLVGDAAGLASPLSGEGIRPAVESGLLAAAAIERSGGRVSEETVHAYERALTARFGARVSPDPHVPADAHGSGLRSRLTELAGATLLGMPWLVRRVLLDRWFLQMGRAPLAA